MIEITVGSVQGLPVLGGYSPVTHRQLIMPVRVCSNVSICCELITA